jgi:hypothetical protein
MSGAEDRLRSHGVHEPITVTTTCEVNNQRAACSVGISRCGSLPREKIADGGQMRIFIALMSATAVYRIRIASGANDPF